MHYRYATPEDACLLAAMNLRLIRDEGHRNPMTVAELEGRMRAWLSGGQPTTPHESPPEYQAVLFEEVGRSVGYALYKQELEHVYLRQFFIEPEFRRQGRGKAALEWLRQNAWRSAKRLRVSVLIHNTRAVAFWHATGFVDYSLTLEQER